MSFDYSNLSGRIVQEYGTQYNFANALGISERSLSLKLIVKSSGKIRKFQKLVNY